jgi:hypothetical protein
METNEDGWWVFKDDNNLPLMFSITAEKEEEK